MLYYILSVLTGALIAGMVAVNGALTAVYGVYLSTVMIHVVGLLFIMAVCLARHVRPMRHARLPLWMYLGGVIGVATTVFNNLAFGRISLTAIVALGLLGQSIAALCIDQFGLCGMPKCTFRPAKLAGIVCMLAGVAYMLRGTAFALMPVIVSLLAGASVVSSRTVNARLAAETGVTVSTWYNYVTGLTVSVLVLLLLGRAELSPLPAFSPRPWIYAGGLLGVFVVLLSNLTVQRIPAFYMTLLLFIGQIFTGIVLDVMMTQALSSANLVGGGLVAAGMVFNLWLDQRQRAAA